MDAKTMAQSDEFKNWMKACSKLYFEYMSVNCPSCANEAGLDFAAGKRYIRVFSHVSNEQRSAWAFVDGNGDILKPASWKTPAKTARGNIYDESAGMSRITPFGPAYLR